MMSNVIPIVRAKRPTLILPNPKRVVDLDWLGRAAQLPGKALAIGCAIWFVVSLHKSPTIRLSPSTLRRFGVSRDAGYDGLRRLAEAQLIALSTCRGRLPRLTVVDREARPARFD